MKQAQKWKLQQNGMWTDKKPDSEIIKEFARDDLILTKEKMDVING